MDSVSHRISERINLDSNSVEWTSIAVAFDPLQPKQMSYWRSKKNGIRFDFRFYFCLSTILLIIGMVGHSLRMRIRCDVVFCFSFWRSLRLEVVDQLWLNASPFTTLINVNAEQWQLMKTRRKKEPIRRLSAFILSNTIPSLPHSILYSLRLTPWWKQNKTAIQWLTRRKKNILAFIKTDFISIRRMERLERLLNNCSLSAWLAVCIFRWTEW